MSDNVGDSVGDIPITTYQEWQDAFWEAFNGGGKKKQKEKAGSVKSLKKKQKKRK